MSPIRAQVHAPAAYADRVIDLATVSGLRATARADLVLLVTRDDDPSVTDQWMVDSLPHLVVRLGPQEIRLGPFVQPGVTACLRCLHAHGVARSPDLASGVDPDPALLTAAIGSAARDLATWHAGDLPITWSSTLAITAGLQPVAQRWARHPHCGCSWGLGHQLVGEHLPAQLGGHWPARHPLASP